MPFAQWSGFLANRLTKYLRHCPGSDSGNEAADGDGHARNAAVDRGKVKSRAVKNQTHVRDRYENDQTVQALGSGDDLKDHALPNSGVFGDDPRRPLSDTGTDCRACAGRTCCETRAEKTCAKTQVCKQKFHY